MALLTLKDIGKIYVSEGNVSVGIRGVNLSFDSGEFVAITGKSGSGKSTLLNVISGMDSYEEGELYIEGETTSHFLQPEWEEYRQKYISFIFQDYNIIESFTVLQNVELALMHISDKKERRRRALELIGRVGLTAHIKHKGSKLSGGQKQRTVIARALAKDSPIILADEPTGNLDSASSAEIIDLLREISRDKLLIMVTHNFEQVEDYVTRHIRVFDGAVEFDRTVREPSRPEDSVGESSDTSAENKRKKKKKKNSNVKNGITLGRAIFTAKPKLSIFLCLLMIVGALGIFAITSLCSMNIDFSKPTMFNHIDGRVVLTHQNGDIFEQEEIDKLVADYGAKSYLSCDLLLDSSTNNSGRWIDGYITDTSNYMMNRHYEFNYTFEEHFGNDILGRYPEAQNEVLLSLPISEMETFGKTEIIPKKINICQIEYDIVGIHYYVDNNIKPRCLLTKDGFETLTAIYYMGGESGSSNIRLELKNSETGEIVPIEAHGFLASFELEKGKVYLKDYDNFVKNTADMSKWTVSGTFRTTYYNYDYYTYQQTETVFSKDIVPDDITTNAPVIIMPDSYINDTSCIVSTDMLRSVADTVLAKSYTQLSLFFENDAAARSAASALNDAGYIAVSSDTTYQPSADETMGTMMMSVLMAAMWVLAIIFLAFFIYLCSSRTLSAFKGDMAIMRSMGIPTKVIRIGMYVRMFIALIPAYICVFAAAYFIFNTPATNGMFAYLYAWHYALIFIGVFMLTLRITHQQIRKLFKESVKKSLKGGAAE